MSDNGMPTQIELLERELATLTAQLQEELEASKELGRRLIKANLEIEELRATREEEI